MDDMYNEGQNHYGSQGKLVLSSPYPDGSVPPRSMNDETSFMPAGSDQTAFMPAGGPSYGTGGNGYPPPQPKKGLFHKLRTDPAYQVLAVAIVVVLIASGSLVAFAATGMMGTGSNHPSNQHLAKVQSTPFTHATQAPIPTPTQAVPTQAPTQAVPTQAPTQAPTKPVMNLTVAFANLPAQVNNNTTTQIVVQTLPGATVQFQVAYPLGSGGTPVFMAQMADGNGMATFNWTAQVQPMLAQTTITAHLTATAVDNNTGQTAQQAANVTVIVNNNGGGGK